MWKVTERESAEMRSLLLRPTPSNLVELVAKLEALATEVARMKAAVTKCGNCDEATAMNLRSFQTEMFRTKRMLASAATFYNGLAALRSTDLTRYERTGMLRNASGSGRVLAQL